MPSKIAYQTNISRFPCLFVLDRFNIPSGDRQPVRFQQLSATFIGKLEYTIINPISTLTKQWALYDMSLSKCRLTHNLLIGRVADCTT